MAVDSASVSKRKICGKDKITSPQKKKAGKLQKPSAGPVENGVPSPAKRTKSPGIRVVGGRIYDSVLGKTCHQCRQKTRDFVAVCTNQRNNKLCPIMFCHKCLLNRYGENAEEVSSFSEWNCPKCRGICNCSICMKKRGHQPTGLLINTAKATGFSSVSDMLLNGAEQLANIIASPKKEAIPRPRKRGKENSFDGKVDANLPNLIDMKSKKSKQVNNGNVDEDAILKIIGKSPNKRKTMPEDVNLDNKITDVLPRETGSLDCAKKAKKAKKVKRDRLADMDSGTDGKVSLKENDVHKLEAAKKGLVEMDDSDKKVCNLSRRTSPRKLTGIDKMPKKGEELDTGADPKGCQIITTKEHNVKKGKKLDTGADPKGCQIITIKENNVKKGKKLNTGADPKDCQIVATKKPNVTNNKMPKKGKKIETGADPKGCQTIATIKDHVTNNKRKKGEETDITNDRNVLKHHQNSDFHEDVPLPLGRELTRVSGINVCTEDVGNALQFLEFCAVFRKILDVKKGQPEHVLQDLLHGRTGRRGKFSAIVQFHIHLLSFIQSDQGDEGETLSPSYGKNSWFHALKKCFSEFQSVHKAQWLDSLDKAADYETLGTSEKLMTLNHLCDVVLETVKVRDWMDDQNKKLAEKVKEAKQEICAAKEKEKGLKKKMQDEIAKTILAKQGALSISEHEAIVSLIKAEAAEAHAWVLESNGKLNNNKTCDAIRIEPIFMGSAGHTYWKLNCSGKSDVLRQNIENDKPVLDEKWFVIDEDGKEAIEKYKCSLREKMLKVSRGSRVPRLFRPTKLTGPII